MKREKSIYIVEGTSALKSSSQTARTMGQTHIIDFDAVRRSREIESRYQQPETLWDRMHSMANVATLKGFVQEAMVPGMQPSREDRKAFWIATGITFCVSFAVIVLCS